ncbi:MFS transporter [Lichenibacterium minor]|uniref:MFS transporter n=1 Tax=Lichenibacterium minor TaxID=2316528 RepID=A0A4Q2UDQ4_9HYPH|nr:MFS transporter [Lichenibacterium minor]RYC33347.1 MFS transporter [Lichenibacterium minor]
MAAPSDARPPPRPAASALPPFLLLYAALYSAYGTESAYLPSFFQSHGLADRSIGMVLSAGTLVRIVSGPAAGRLADRLGARRGVLAAAALLSGLIGTLYLGAYGLVPLLLVCLAHSCTEATLAPLSDALAVAASAARGGFRYGWVRGTGSAAFVAGTLLSGQLVDRFGLGCIIGASSALFLAMALSANRVAAPDAAGEPDRGGTLAAARALLAMPAYRTLLLVAALVIGSHAVNDAFAVITWRGAGYGGTAVSLLWSESVLAEVAVFFVAGPWIIDRVGPAGAAAISAGAGVLRWGVMGATVALPALVAVQALHGLTFALLHLGAMKVIGTAVPERLGATAQAVYGNIALGVASAALTFASGYLYAGLGIRAFWVMAALCGLALVLAPGLGRGAGPRGASRPAKPVDKPSSPL